MSGVVIDEMIYFETMVRIGNCSLNYKKRVVQLSITILIRYKNNKLKE